MMKPDPSIDQNVKQVVPFLSISNMNKPLGFYCAELGFEITHQWIDEGVLRWCWLQRGGASLMLQEFKEEGQDSWTPESKVGVGVTLIFICEDATEIYRQLKKGSSQATKPVVSNGMWFTSLTDPDGYQIAFESYTDAPEGAEYDAP